MQKQIKALAGILLTSMGILFLVHCVSFAGVKNLTIKTQTLLDQQSPVVHAAFVKDCEQILLVSEARAIMYDRTDDKQMWRFNSPGRPFKGGQVVPGGKNIIVWSLFEIYLLDGETGREENRFELSSTANDYLRRAVVYPASPAYIFLDGNKSMAIGKFADGKFSSIPHPEDVTDYSLSPDMETFLYSNKHGQAIHDRSAKKVFNLDSYFTWVNPPKFSIDSQTALMDSRDRMVLLNIKDRHTLQQFFLQEKVLSASAISHDLSLVANGTIDGRITIWSTDAGLEAGTVRIHSDTVSTLSFHPARSGEMVSGAKDGKAVLLKLMPDTIGKVKEPVPSSLPRLNVQQGQCVEKIAISNTGETVVTGSGTKAVLWHARTGRSLRTFLSQKDNTITSLAISLDGNFGLAGFLLNGLARVWDLRTGKKTLQLGGHDAPVKDVAYSPDGRYILTAQGESNSADRKHLGKVAVLWDAETGRQIRRFPGHERGINTISFSPDASVFLSGSKDGTAILWEVGTGKSIRKLSGHKKGVTSVDISPDGRRGLTVSRDGVVRIWDLSTGQVLNTLKSFNIFERPIYDASFTNMPGKIVGRDSLGLCLFNLDTGEEDEFISGNYTITGIGLSPNKAHLVSGGCRASSRIRNIKTLKAGQRLKPTSSRITSIAATKDMRKLVVCHEDYCVVWDLRKGRVSQMIDFDIKYPFATKVQVSPDGSKVLVFDRENISIHDTGTGEKQIYKRNVAKNPATAKGGFSVDNRYAIVPAEDLVQIIDVRSGQLISQLKGHGPLKVKGKAIKSFQNIWDTAFSPDGEKVITTGTDSTIRLWNTRTGEQINVYQDFSNFNSDGSGSIHKLVFLPEGKRFAALLSELSFDQILIFDTNTRQAQKRVKIDEDVKSIALSRDGKTLIAGYKEKIAKLWDLETGKVIHTLSGHDGQVKHVEFSADEKLLLTVSNATLTVWNAGTGKMMARMMAFKDRSWAVVDGQGHYDSNSPGDLPQLSWIMPDEPMTPYPIEIFMKEYFEPGLLPKLMAGENLPQVPELSRINRIQPDVKILEITPMAEGREDSVKVIVETKTAQKQVRESGKTVTRTAQAYDLRLFRNGQLVGYAPETPGRVGTDPETGTARIIFKDIKLPTASDKKSVIFSAYAFNEDGVKSMTHKMKYRLRRDIEPGRSAAYVIAIGANSYENPAWDLSYAANDARVYAQLISSSLGATGQFDDVVVIPLISDRGAKGLNAFTQKEEQPEKATIKAVFDLLSGRDVGPGLRTKIPLSDRIQKAHPDDLLFVSYSGHGLTDDNHQFHLFPSDIGGRNTRFIDDELFGKSISGRELSMWMRDVDAGTFVMIIDACNSAASVEGNAFKPGPMGSRGLGQLAYDKGMRILTASQAESVALESSLIKHGVLSYALLKEGIDWQMADIAPKNNQIMIGEWLKYGLERVPQLYAQIRKGELTAQGGLPQHRGTVLLFGQDREEKAASRMEGQLPGLFDFIKNRQDKVLKDIGI